MQTTSVTHTKRPTYEALDHHGLPYLRDALIIGELPTPEARMAALESATFTIANKLQMSAHRRIGFATAVHIAFGLTRPQAKNHASAKLLLTSGEDFSLDFCPEYNAQELP